METVTDFIFLVSRITADSDCSHEIKRPLLFGRKTMTNLDSILKSRDITLPAKVRIVQAMVFPVVVYGCESWTIKKNWCIQTVVPEKTLESPLDCKEIKPVHPKGKSVLNIHWKDWCWSWSSNPLATWWEELTHWKGPWCWERLTEFILAGSKITVDSECSHEIKRHLLPGRKTMTNLDSILKSRDITLLTKVHLAKAISSSHAWMWELDHKEGWAWKNWCFQTVVLEETLEIPLDCKEIKPVNPRGNQPWIFTGRTDAEAETPILWSPDVKSWLIGGKTPNAGKDGGQEEKGMTKDEMVR